MLTALPRQILLEARAVVVMAVITGLAACIVKFTFDISKKIFPTASTFTLAVVVGEFGTVMFSDPSLGVLANNTVGKVFPPSVERDIFTLAQLTGAFVVLATFHVTACVAPVFQVTAVLGTVTTNGPEELLVVTTMSSLLFAGPPA